MTTTIAIAFFSIIAIINLIALIVTILPDHNENDFTILSSNI